MLTKNKTSAFAQNVLFPDPLKNTRYSPAVLNQMRLHKSTALPDHHAFPKIVDNYARYGEKRFVPGGDNITRLWIELPGGYQGKQGKFHWIIEPNGEINHRFFSKGLAMEFNKNKALNFTINKSIPLNRFGINEVGWRKEDAIELIENIICDHTLILGGSVYRLNHDTLQSTCESWSCNYQENEKRHHYYARSRETALTYIKSYQDSSETIFVLVFSGAFKDLLSLIDNKKPEFLLSLTLLDGKWCMCPVCIDAWECSSQDERVICPKCNNIFSNPLFQL